MTKKTELNQDVISRYLSQNTKGGFALIESADSTNDALKKIVAHASFKDVLSLMAVFQTMGRGRGGKSFFSPPGGIYLSMAFPSQGEINPADNLFTLRAGAAVHKSLTQFCADRFLLKWVNDIYGDNGKKICGILAETTPNGTICGIGVNVYPPERDAGCSNEMSSVIGYTSEFNENVDINRLAAAIIDELHHAIVSGDVSGGEIVDYYNAHSWLTGKKVKIGETVGIADRIAADGSLVIKAESGEKSFYSGSAELADSAI